MNDKSELSKEQKEAIELLHNLPQKIPQKSEKLSSSYLPTGELKVEKINKKVNKIEYLSVEDEIKLLEPFTSDDELRPAMTGVYLDGNEGLLASTDAFKLVCIFDSRIKGSKSQIVNPENGEIIDGIYPKINQVIPQEIPPSLFINVQNTFDIVNGVIRANKFYNDEPNNIKLRIEYNSESYFYNPKDFVDALKLLLQLGYENVGIELQKKVTTALTIRTNDVLVLVMPIYKDLKDARYVTIPHSNEKQNQMRSKALSNKETGNNSLDEYYKLDFSSDKVIDIKSMYNPELTKQENAVAILKNLPKKLPKKYEKIDINDLPFGELDISTSHNDVREIKNPTVDDEIKLLVPFISSDKFRPSTTGVYLDSDIGALVATDSHRISCIFDKRIIGLGNKIINPKDGKKIDEKFPDYQSVIPRNTHLKINVNSNDVLDVAQGVVLANKFFADFSKDYKDIMFRLESDLHYYFYNAKFILEGFKLLLQLGYKNVTIEISGVGYLIVRTNELLVMICPLNIKDKALETARYVTIKGKNENEKLEHKVQEEVAPEYTSEDIKRLIRSMQRLADMGDEDAKRLIRSLKRLLN